MNYSAVKTQPAVYGSAPGLLTTALVFAILGAIGWGILGVTLAILGIIALFVAGNASLTFWAVYSLISFGIAIWVAARTGGIRRALRYQDTVSAAALNTVSVGTLALMFGNLLTGIFLLIARGGILKALRAQEPSLGAVEPFVFAGMGGAARNLGRLALILFGVGLILLVAVFYTDALVIFLRLGALSISELTSLALVIASGAMLLTVAALAMKAGSEIARGESVRTSAFVALVSFAVLLLLVGANFVVLASRSLQPTAPSVFAFTAGALLIAGGGLYLGRAPALKLAGSAVGIAGVGTLLAGGLEVVVASFIIGRGFLAVGFIRVTPAPFLLREIIVVASFVLAGVAAALYPLLKDTRVAGASGIVAGSAFLVFGVGTASWSAAVFAQLALGFGFTTFVRSLMSDLGVFFLMISGLAITVASGLAIAFFAQGMARRVPSPVAMPREPEAFPTPTGPASPPFPAMEAPAPAVMEGVVPEAMRAEEEDWMVRLMQQIDDLEQAIQEQQDFLFRLDEALVEGRVEPETYAGIKEPRLERIEEMQGRLTEMRRHLDPAASSDLPGG